MEHQLRARVVRVQAGYYLATGLWPLLHRRSFEAVTGPKVDFWLVRTVGATVAAVGAGLTLSVRRRRMSGDMRLTAALAAAGLAAIDVVYVTRRRISPIYLLDAAAEVAFAAALTAGAQSGDAGP